MTMHQVVGGDASEAYHAPEDCRPSYTCWSGERPAVTRHPYRWLAVLIAAVFVAAVNVGAVLLTLHGDPVQGLQWAFLVPADLAVVAGGITVLWLYEPMTQDGGPK